jgi:predicted GIY-YIG superfamily endonuclease
VDDYQNVCYLIHFDKPVNKAGVQHYLGFAKHLPDRIASHRASTGSEMTRRANKAGISWSVVRVWSNADADAEKSLKKLGGINLCPICSKFYPRTKKINQSQVPSVASSYST